jgi:hypothetical protein
MSSPPRLLLLLAAVPALVHAQAPVITAAGDPSINDSLIYSRTVSDSDYVGKDYVLLFEDGIVRLDADGRRVFTYRQVIQILTQSGTEAWGELAYQYTPDRETWSLNWLKVFAADGVQVSDGPAHEQESAPDVSFNVPVYTDKRIKRITVGGLEPGAILDVSFSNVTFDPSYPSDFHFSWQANQMIDVRKSRFVVDVPTSIVPRVRVQNVDHGFREYVAGDRRVFEFESDTVPGIEWEELTGSPNEVHVGQHCRLVSEPLARPI